ncbi:hypothetical protein Lal_00006275 [Lupinus albus]|nr:hypothetical protein Lal_00006275 [Lupinus albus]
MEEATFECDLIRDILKRVWTTRSTATDALDSECVNKLLMSFTATGRCWNIKEESSNFWFCDFVVLQLCYYCELLQGTQLVIIFIAANGNALKLTCELLRVFITEAVQRAAAIAEAEGVSQIEATHLESILPQLLLDF